MYNLTGRKIAFLLLPMLAGIPACKPAVPPSGTYTVTTFEFVPSRLAINVGEVIPTLWIDTNLKLSGLSGGTLMSSLPCSVKIDYTDNSFLLKDVVFTSLKITYDDETEDPSAKAVKMPMRIAATEYESVNSIAGGHIVRSKAWIISGTIPNAITRAEPFRLRMDGYFTKDDNTRIPFAIDQHFDIKKESAVKTREQVVQDK